MASCHSLPTLMLYLRAFVFSDEMKKSSCPSLALRSFLNEKICLQLITIEMVYQMLIDFDPSLSIMSQSKHEMSTIPTRKKTISPSVINQSMSSSHDSHLSPFLQQLKYVLQEYITSHCLNRPFQRRRLVRCLRLFDQLQPQTNRAQDYLASIDSPFHSLSIFVHLLKTNYVIDAILIGFETEIHHLREYAMIYYGLWQTFILQDQLFSRVKIEKECSVQHCTRSIFNRFQVQIKSRMSFALFIVSESNNIYIYIVESLNVSLIDC